MINLDLKHLFKFHLFLPQDHGSWVFVVSPILAGMVLRGGFLPGMAGIILAAISFFLLRQPLGVLVKVYAGRRDSKDFLPALVWSIFYGILLLISIGMILLNQQHYILATMAVPAALMLGWQFILVYRRNERKQRWFEVLSTGLLGFIAAALLWVDSKPFDSEGLLLWLLLFLQAGASIFHAYTRLEQRVWPSVKTFQVRLSTSASTLVFSAFNLVLIVSLGMLEWVSPWLWLAFALQFLEAILGIFQPATGFKPTAIGFRQLAVSVLFLFVLVTLW
jgi:hypothetical protein